MDYVQNKNEAQIEVSNLKEGMVLKNYPTLCNLLGEKQLNGYSKVAQMKRWHRYFDWEQKGQKFVILDVYEEPLPKELSDNATYAKFLELILMNALTYCEDGIYYFYQNELFEVFGMVDPDYKNLRKEEYIESAFGPNGNEIDCTEVSTYGARVFSRLTYKRMADIINSALRGLVNSGLILYKKGYAIKRKNEDGKFEYETATDIEERMILKAEQCAMDDLHITSKWFGYNSNRKKEFIDTINKYIQQFDDTAYGALQRFTIIYNKPPETHLQRVEKKIKKELRNAGYVYNDDQDSRDLLTKQCKQVLNDMVVCTLNQYSNYKAKDARNKLIKGANEWGLNAGDGTKEYMYLAGGQFKFEFDTLIDRFVKYSYV